MELSVGPSSFLDYVLFEGRGMLVVSYNVLREVVVADVVDADGKFTLRDAYSWGRRCQSLSGCLG